MTIEGDVLARAVEDCKTFTARYLQGFDDQSARAQPPGLPNHVIWCLGHLSLTMMRIVEKLNGQPIPESMVGTLPNAFTSSSIAFASVPTDAVGAYPSLARAIEIYNEACDHLAAAARGATQEKLDSTSPWAGGTPRLAALIARMVFHNGFHTGQIADTRRGLQMKSIFA